MIIAITLSSGYLVLILRLGETGNSLSMPSDSHDHNKLRGYYTKCHVLLCESFIIQILNEHESKRLLLGG